MSQEDSINSAAFVLKVGMYCNACRKEVYKVLHKIEGVDQVDIDAEKGTVTVSGNIVDAAILLKALKKAGKRTAELLCSELGMNDHLNDRLEDGKGQQEDNDKPQNGGGGGLKKMKLPQLKGLKFPFRKNKKSVKFDLPPENNVDEEKDNNKKKDDHEEANDIHDGNEDNQNHGHDDNNDDEEDNQNQGDDNDDDKEDNQNQGDDNDDEDKEDNQNQGGGGGGENGGGNNNAGAQPMFCPYMMGQGFQCVHLGRKGNMPHAPVNDMGNFPAGAVPPGYFQGGMMAPEMFAPPANPYHQQYMAAMMERQRMMTDGQGGSAANPPMAYRYEAPSCGPRAPRYVDPYTTMFSDENPNACSIM